ncbi:MAG: hypothetical protein ACYTEQ_26650 [Planctomycetota bacterium]|jgi:hypothetical protein
MWSILYHDGFRFSSGDGTVDEIPFERCFGVMGIWLPDGKSLYNKDFYIWREDFGVWIEVDRTGLEDHLCLAPRQVVKLLKGLTVPWAQYHTALDVMKALRPDG